jgi:hypothetical protein
MWARDSSDDGQPCSAPKESSRWIEGYERVAEMAGGLPATRLVHVAYREADLVELMRRTQPPGTPADWMVRAKHNRCLPEGQRLWSPFRCYETRTRWVVYNEMPQVLPFPCSASV